MTHFFLPALSITLSVALACGGEATGDTATTTADASTGTSDAATTTATSTTTEVPATTTTTEALTTSGATTSDATTDATTTGGACEPEATDECGMCMRDSCCEDLAACQDDPKCVACVTGEDGTQCEANEQTHARVQRFLECRGGPCQASCIGAEGESCEEALADIGPPACSDCLAENCCDAVAACATNAICWDGCLTNHNPDKCHSDPDGHALYHALAVCMQGSCTAACSG